MKDPRLNIPGQYIEHGAIAFKSSKTSTSKELEALRKEVRDNNKLVNELIQLLQQQLQVPIEGPNKK